MMPAFFGGFRVLPPVFLREDPLPATIGGQLEPRVSLLFYFYNFL